MGIVRAIFQQRGNPKRHTASYKTSSRRQSGSRREMSLYSTPYAPGAVLDARLSFITISALVGGPATSSFSLFEGSDQLELSYLRLACNTAVCDGLGCSYAPLRKKIADSTVPVQAFDVSPSTFRTVRFGNLLKSAWIWPASPFFLMLTFFLIRCCCRDCCLLCVTGLLETRSRVGWFSFGATLSAFRVS